MKSLTKLLLLVIGALIYAASPAELTAQDKPQILFLHLQFKDGSVTLLSATLRPGTLKTPPRTHGDIQIDLLSPDAQPLWTTFIEDPLVQRYEYEDPDNPGHLKRIERKLLETEFVLRVPFHAKAKQLLLSRKKPQNPGEAAQAKQIVAALDLPTPKEGK